MTFGTLLLLPSQAAAAPNAWWLDPKQEPDRPSGLFETVASLPGADSKIARQEQEESTWDPLNASELAPNSANGLIPSLIAWAKSQSPGNIAIVSVVPMCPV